MCLTPLKCFVSTLPLFPTCISESGNYMKYRNGAFPSEESRPEILYYHQTGRSMH